MDSITFRRSYYEAICEMPKETQLELFHAVFQREFDGIDADQGVEYRGVRRGDGLRLEGDE